MALIIFPAIDLRGGQVVRLEQGRADAQTVYGDDPAAQARAFLDAGAEWLHCVDLDGAFTGEPANRDALRAIAATGLKVQTGGGLRSMEAVEAALEAGARRVVIGTRACEDPGFIELLCERFGEQVVIGLDVKDGFVAVKGWVEASRKEPDDFIREMMDLGAKRFVFTDVSRDGMLTGPNFDALETLLTTTSGRIIASGGVGDLSHVEKLASLVRDYPCLEGVIIGKALYDGRLELKEALAAGRG